MRFSYPLDKFMRSAANDDRLLTSHISLFMAMFYYSPEKSTDAAFQVSRKKLMRYSKIKSIATYHKCVRELVEFGYIHYTPSYHPKKGSTIALLVNDQKL